VSCAFFRAASPLANIIKGIEEVKGNDITILDLREIDTAVATILSFVTEIQIHKLTQ
jgi:ribosomal silencing factor RsfS